MQSSSIRIFGLAALIGLSAGILHAASDTWDGGNSAMWADGTNWVGDAVAPGSGETATFSGAGNGNTTINLGAGTTVGALAFDTASAAAYTIGSGGVGAQTLTLTTPSDTPAVSVSSSVVNDQTIHANILHNTADNTLRLVNNNATQALTVSGTIQGGSGTSQRIINSTGNVSLNGAVSAGSASSSPNLAQVAAGMAWHYREYEREQSLMDRLRYAHAEGRAQEERRGLWADRAPVAPWDFRRAKREAAGR